jgi:hypothetical protein
MKTDILTLTLNMDLHESAQNLISLTTDFFLTRNWEGSDCVPYKPRSGYLEKVRRSLCYCVFHTSRATHCVIITVYKAVTILHIQSNFQGPLRYAVHKRKLSKACRVCISRQRRYKHLPADACDNNTCSLLGKNCSNNHTRIGTVFSVSNATSSW